MQDRPGRVDDLDWKPEHARRFGDRVMSLWQELLARVPELPVHRREGWKAVEDAVVRDVPEAPMSDADLAAYLKTVLLEHSTFCGHPRFMAYISGAGTVPGALADLLAAAVNQNVGGWILSPAATSIEIALTKWFSREFGLPEGAFGLLVSGGAMATFTGLKAARDHAVGLDVRKQGLQGNKLAFYMSTEAHAVIERAADMLGLGTDAVRKIPVDDEFRMRVDALDDAVKKDVAAGVKPAAIIGTAGTVATGAIDPLSEIADVCAKHGAWFHVDGAYGALAVLADELRPMYRGIERADTIAFDPHKWLYTPHSGGCVVARDPQKLVDCFAVRPTYVQQDKDHTGAGLDLSLMGPQFSRGFQALKVWVSLLAHGRAAYARRIAHDVTLAKYMAARVDAHSELERTSEVTLSICCFRYKPPGKWTDEYLDQLNTTLMNELQVDGRAFCSNAVLNGRYCLRACIVNFRTEAEDVDALLDTAVDLGRQLHERFRATSA